MSDSPDTATTTIDSHRHNSRLNQVLAWVGIVAGLVFIVAAVFFSGFILGRGGDGYGWHRGYQTGQMRPGGQGAGCPMMQMMQPGGMGTGGMPGMGTGGMPGMGSPSMTPPMSPPTAGR